MSRIPVSWPVLSALLLAGCSATISPPVQPPTTASSGSLSEQKKASLYRSGHDNLEVGATDVARQDWERIHASDPTYRDVGRLLIREYQVQGLEAYAHGDWGEAIRWWELAVDLDPGDARSKAYLKHAREQVRLLEEWARARQGP